ncbi:MAG: hypothetical protein GF329_05800 [Candidatus Lokiarchaeota archaeon]|nr:hypothetical protein [Candidatus Lokiarchaeota archaeon]
MIPKYKDIRYNLTNIQIQILELLKRESMYGYQIIQKFAERGVKLNTAVLYPSLRNLGELGLAEYFKTEQARGSKARKNYRLTDRGFSFLQSLYDISNVPIHYLQAFTKEISMIKNFINEKDCLIIDSTNFLNARELLATRFFFEKIPRDLEILRYYNFKSKENVNPKDFIFVIFPFFIQQEINEPFKEYLLTFFKKVKDILNNNGEVWIVDVFWENHAIIDTLTYMMVGEVRKMGFTIDEMKEIVYSLHFKNFKIIKKTQGVILFSIS